ncbi:MAG: hypothetical protein PHN86_04285 [Proteiniphilum sp.]|nr:hypothetical protein [Proteiniphilum sp.]
MEIKIFPLPHLFQLQVILLADDVLRPVSYLLAKRVGRYRQNILISSVCLFTYSAERSESSGK